jgi:hypothetical protein
MKSRYIHRFLVVYTSVDSPVLLRIRLFLYVALMVVGRTIASGSSDNTTKYVLYGFIFLFEAHMLLGNHVGALQQRYADLVSRVGNALANVWRQRDNNNSAHDISAHNNTTTNLTINTGTDLTTDST